jgi:hypothetical protein
VYVLVAGAVVTAALVAAAAAATGSRGSSFFWGPRMVNDDPFEAVISAMRASATSVVFLQPWHWHLSEHATIPV